MRRGRLRLGHSPCDRLLQLRRLDDLDLALRAAAERDSIKARLKQATATAGDLGVIGVPSVVVGDTVFWGDDRLEEAAAAA